MNFIQWILFSEVMTVFCIYFEVSSYEQSCFFDEVEANSLVLGNYSVYPLDAGLIDFTVQNNQNQFIITKSYSDKNDFSFTSASLGDYTFCFIKSQSLGRMKY
jgi:hypothetical protein